MMNIKPYLTLLFLMVISLVGNLALASTTKYFGNIRYNHVSPHVAIKGVNPLTKPQSNNRPHFIFTYNDRQQLIEIIDKSYHVKKRHHLASFGAYKVVFNYDDNKETRTFFDVNNQPMANIKGEQIFFF